MAYTQYQISQQDNKLQVNLVKNSEVISTSEFIASTVYLDKSPCTNQITLRGLLIDSYKEKNLVLDHNSVTGVPSNVGTVTNITVGCDICTPSQAYVDLEAYLEDTLGLTTCSFTVIGSSNGLSSNPDLGTATLGCGEAFIFTSTDGTINIAVTDGSAIIDHEVNLSSDTNNSIIVDGTDGIYSPKAANQNAGVPVIPPTNKDSNVTWDNINNLLYVWDGAAWQPTNLNDIYVDGATYNSATLELTLTDTSGTSPDVVVDLSDLTSNITQLSAGVQQHESGNGTDTLLQNIYSSDGQITDDRDVDANGNYLHINNASNIQLNATGQVDIDSATGEYNLVSTPLSPTGNAEILIRQTDGSLRVLADGNSDEFLQTDGAGNLAWASQLFSQITNVSAGVQQHDDGKGVTAILTNIYSSDGTFLGARAINANGNSYTLNAVAAYTLNADNANINTDNGISLSDVGGVYNLVVSPPNSTGASEILLRQADGSLRVLGDGTADQVLRTDGAGNYSWVDNVTSTITTTSAGVQQHSDGDGTNVQLFNIYSSDGTLLGNRTITGAGNNYTITGVNTYSTNANVIMLDASSGSYSLTTTPPNPTLSSLLMTRQTDGTLRVIADGAAGYALRTDGAGNYSWFDTSETVTTLVDNGDGSYTYTSEDGTVTTITDTTVTTFANLIAGNRIATFTSEDGTTYDIDETITTIVDNADGTYTFTSENGTTTVIDTVNSVTNVIAGNRIATFTSTDGSSVDIDETITTLVDNGNGSFTYTSENGTVVTWNETNSTLVDNGDGTYTFTNEDSVVTTIDTTVTTDDTLNGDGVNTDLGINFSTDANNIAGTGSDGGLYINDISIDPSSTQFLSYNPATRRLSIEAIAITDVEVDTVSADIATFVAGNYTGTEYQEGDVIIVTTDGTAWIHNGGAAGTVADFTQIDAPNTSDAAIRALFSSANAAIDYNAVTGVYTFTLDPANNDATITANGLRVDVSAGEVIDTNNLTGGGVGSSTDVQTLFDSIPPETNTTFTNLVAGNLIGTFTNEAGTTFDLDETITTITDNADGTYTFTNESGATLTFGVITGITNVIAGNRIATYTSEDGTVTDIDESITTLADNADGTYTYTNEAGATQNIDTTVSTDNTLSGDGVNTSLSVLLSTDAGNSISYGTDGRIYAASDTITTLVDNADGTYTYTSEDGTVTVISDTSVTTFANLQAGNRIATFTSEDGTVYDIDETITTLVDNLDGTYTYTSENGTVTTISDTTVTVMANLIAGNRIATFTSEDGTNYDIDETITSFSNLVAGNLIARYTNESGVTFDIDETVTTLVDNLDGTYTFTSEDGTVTTISDTTVTTFANLINGNRIGTFTSEDGTTYDIDETVTTLIDNANGSFTYTNESGATTTWNESTTSMGNLQAGNLIGRYTNEDGATFDIDETVTTLTDNGNGSFTHVSEDGTSTTWNETTTGFGSLQAGKLIGRYTDEDGTTYDIDETITTLVDNLDGTFTYISEDGTTTTIGDGTVTTMTNVIAGNRIGTYTNEVGAVVDIDETITTLVDNADGSFTYTSEDGTATTYTETTTSVTDLQAGNLIGRYVDENGTTYDIDESITTLVDNLDGTYTYTSEDGTVTTIMDTSVTSFSNLQNGKLIGRYTNEQGTTFDIDETVTSITDNGNGSFTYTDEDGGTLTWNETTTSMSNLQAGNLIARFTDEDGTTYDIDESITTLVDNADGTFTYTSEDGTATTISGAAITAFTNLIAGNRIGTFTNEAGTTFDIDETITDLTDNGNGSFTYTAEDGSTITWNETTVSVTNTQAGNRIATVTNEDGVAVDIDETITTLTNTLAGNRIATHTSEDGTAVDIDETVTTLTDNGNRTFTYVSEDGTSTTYTESTVGVTNVIAGNRIATVTNEAGTAVDIDETITTLTDNGNGSFSYISEDGTITNWNETTTSFSNLVGGDRIATYTDEDGTTTDIYQTITTLIDNADGTYTYSREDGTTTVVDTTVSTDDTILGDGVNTPLGIDFSTDANNIATTGTDGGLYVNDISIEAGSTAFLGYNSATRELSVTSLAITTTTVDTVSADINAFVAGNYTGTEFQEGDLIIITTDGTSWIHNGGSAGTAADFTQVEAPSTSDAAIRALFSSANAAIDYNAATGVFTFTLDPSGLNDASITANGLMVDVSAGAVTDTNNLLGGGAGATTDVQTLFDAITPEVTTTMTNVIAGNRIGTYTNELGATVDIDESITSFASLQAGNIIGQYTSEDGTTYDIDESVTTLTDNANGSFTYVSEDGTSTTWNETTTSVSNLIAGNRIATYTDEDGGTFDIDESITTVTNVQAGNRIATHTSEDGTAVDIDESVTSFASLQAGNLIGQYTSEDGTTYDIDETITSVTDNGDGTFTYTAEDGTTGTISNFYGVDGTLSANRTVTGGTNDLTFTGVGTMTSSAATQVWDATSGSYTITTDPAQPTTATEILVRQTADGRVHALADGTAGQFLTTDGSGVLSWGTAPETTTTMTNVIAGNRIGTYTNELGATVDIDESVTTLTDNTNGSFTYVSEDGTSVTWNETSTTITNLVAGNLIGRFTNEDGTTYDIDETITTLTDNADGSFTYVSEDGTSTTWNETTVLVSNTQAGNRIATVTNEDGTAVDIDETVTTLTNVIAGNRIGTHTSEDGTAVDIDESVTTLVDNANGSFTYTSEDGTATTWNETTVTVSNVIAGNRIATVTNEDATAVDIDETVTTLVDNGNSSFTYTSEDGTATTYTEVATSFNNLQAGNLIGRYTNEAGTTYDIDETITSFASLQAGNLIGRYTAEDGTAYDIDETITTLVDNGDGTYTYTSEDGTVTTISDSSVTTMSNLQAGNLIGRYTNEQGTTYDIDETITTLVDNANGSFTYTSENGTVTTFNETTTSFNNLQAGNLIGRYTDEDGATYDIDETITTVVSNANGSYTYTSEDGSTVTLNNIYSADGTLAANRTVTGGGNDFTVTGVNTNTLSAAAQVIDATGGSYTLTTSPATPVSATELLLRQTADGRVRVLADGTAGQVLSTDGSGNLTWTAAGGAETTTTMTNLVAGNRIGTYTNEAAATFDIDESITTLVDNADATWTYTSENGTTTTIDNFYSANGTLTGARTVTGAGNNLSYTGLGNFSVAGTQMSLDSSTNDYRLVTTPNNPASASEVVVRQTADGRVRVLADGTANQVLQTDGSGNVSWATVTLTETNTTMTNLIAGNRIGTFTNEAATTFDIDETITSLVDNADGTYTYTREDGTTTAIDTTVSTAATLTGDGVNTNLAINFSGDANNIATTGTDGGLYVNDISIEAGSTQYLSYNAATRELGVSALAITDVTVDTGVADINAWVTANYTGTEAQEGDVVIITTDGTAWIHNGGSAGTVADFTQIEAPSTSDAAIRALFSSANAAIDYNATTGVYTFTLDPAAANDLSITANGLYLDVAAAETTTTMTNLVAGNRIATYTDEDGGTFDIDETVTTLADNADGTWDYTSEDGTGTTISNFYGANGTLSANRTVTGGGNDLTFTGVGTSTQSAVTQVWDATSGSYTLTTDPTQPTTAAELMVRQTADGRLHAIADGTNGQILQTDGAGGIAWVNPTAASETTTTFASLQAGNLIGTYTNEVGTTYDIDETITTVTNLIAGNRIATYNAEDGTTFEIDESITTLVDNGDGTFTYTSENGTGTTVSNFYATNGTLTGNRTVTGGANDLTYTGLGTHSNTAVTQIFDATSGSYTLNTDPAQPTSAVEILLRQTADGRVHALADGTAGQVLSTDGSGNLSWTNAGAGGNTSVINALTAGVQQHDDGTGTTTTLSNLYSADGTLTGNRTITGGGNDLTVTGVGTSSQSATTQIWDATSGSYTLTTNAPTPTGSVQLLTRQADGTLRVISDGTNGQVLTTNGAGTLTWADDNNTDTTIINLQAGNRIGTYTNESGTTYDIDESITSFASLQAGNLIGRYTGEDGTTYDIDETITTLVDNANGSFTYTSENGTVTTWNETTTTMTNLQAGKRIATYTDEDGGTFDVDETITTMVDNADGTWTYTSETGVTTTINGGTSAITNLATAGHQQHTDGNGNNTTISNIYTQDGTLSGARTITGTGDDYTLTNVDVYTVSALGGITFNDTGGEYILQTAPPTLQNNANNVVFRDSVTGGLKILSDGTNGQVLTTDGAGTLSWSSVAGGGGNTSVINALTAGVQEHDDGSGTTTTLSNIYSSDGTLTGARAVDGGGNDYEMTNVSRYAIASTDDIRWDSATGDYFLETSPDALTTQNAELLLRQTNGKVRAMAMGANDTFLSINSSGDYEWVASSGGDNIYTADGTLTANRTVDGGGTRTMTFTNNTQFNATGQGMNLTASGGIFSLSSTLGWYRMAVAPDPSVFGASASSLMVRQANGYLSVLADGTNGQVLSTDGSGNLSWIAAGGSETTTTLVDNTDGTYTYTNEAAATSTIDVRPAVNPSITGTGVTGSELTVDFSADAVNASQLGSDNKVWSPDASTDAGNILKRGTDSGFLVEEYESIAIQEFLASDIVSDKASGDIYSVVPTWLSNFEIVEFATRTETAGTVTVNLLVGGVTVATNSHAASTFEETTGLSVALAAGNQIRLGTSGSDNTLTGLTGVIRLKRVS